MSIDKKSRVLKVWFGIGVAFLLIMVWMFFVKSNPTVPTTSPTPVLQQDDIVVRGRIEPLGRVHLIQGPTVGGVVNKLLVNEGQHVNANQILALLEGYDAQAATVSVAEQTLLYSKTQRQQVASQAKQSDISAQEDVIASKEVELLRAKKDLARQELLYSSHAIALQELELGQSNYNVAEKTLQQERHLLLSLREVRGVDNAVALAKIKVDEASLVKTRVDLDRFVVKAPISGTILSVKAREGEAISADGILRMAAMEKLIAVAEVDERFMSRINKDMNVSIESSLLTHAVPAKINCIGNELFKQTRPNSDTLVGRDARIVEIEITPMEDLPPVLGAELIVRFSRGKS